MQVDDLARSFLKATKDFSGIKKRRVQEIRMVLFDGEMTDTVFKELKDRVDRENSKWSLSNLLSNKFEG
jgi:hypothetical protein